MQRLDLNAHLIIQSCVLQKAPDAMPDTQVFHRYSWMAPGGVYGWKRVVGNSLG